MPPSLALFDSKSISGTTFTLELVQEATNLTTAANYRQESEIKSHPVPIHPDLLNLGPWIHKASKEIPRRLILTKTHCLGYLEECPDSINLMPGSFRGGCLSQFNSAAAYPIELVKKAVHIMRHPLDNIVARFRFYSPLRNRDDFVNWCRNRDARDEIKCQNHTRVELEARKNSSQVPCYQDFFRYTKWHNNSFSLIDQNKNISSFFFHYEDYGHHFENTTRELLNFLELEPVRKGAEFVNGKRYLDYYTENQTKAIWKLVYDLASPETRKALAYYNPVLDE